MFDNVSNIGLVVFMPPGASKAFGLWIEFKGIETYRPDGLSIYCLRLKMWQSLDNSDGLGIKQRVRREHHTCIVNISLLVNIKPHNGLSLYTISTCFIRISR